MTNWFFVRFRHLIWISITIYNLEESFTIYRFKHLPVTVVNAFSHIYFPFLCEKFKYFLYRTWRLIIQYFIKHQSKHILRHLSAITYFPCSQTNWRNRTEIKFRMSDFNSLTKLNAKIHFSLFISVVNTRRKMIS